MYGEVGRLSCWLVMGFLLARVAGVAWVVPSLMLRLLFIDFEPL